MVWASEVSVLLKDQLTEVFSKQITRFSSVFTSNRAAAAILWQILSIIKCPRGNEAKKQEEYLRHKSCKGWKPLLRIQSFCLSHPCHCTITWLDKTSEICRFEPRFSTFSFFSSHFYTFLFKPQELQLSIEIFWGCSAGKSVDPRQRCKMSRIWRINPCKNIGNLGWKFGRTHNFEKLGLFWRRFAQPMWNVSV